MFIGPNYMTVRANQKLIHRSILGLPACEARNNLGKCDEAEDVNDEWFGAGDSLRTRWSPVGPFPRHRERAEFRVTQTQCLDTRNASCLQNNESLTAQRMKRVNDLRRSQRPFGEECSLPGAWRSPEVAFSCCSASECRPV